MRVVYLDKGERIEVPTVVCLGFFDGVHRGHAALIARARTVADEKRLSVCVHTFDTMPVRTLRPDAQVRELTPLGEKATLLGALGVDIVAVSTFSTEIMRMPARTFFDEILLGQLKARHIVAGFHHHFGYRGEGDAKLLEQLSLQAGIGCDIIAPVTLDSGELISSTAIRQAVGSGDYDLAARMLGRPWQGDVRTISEGRGQRGENPSFR